jgi:hypothetical protein
LDWFHVFLVRHFAKEAIGPWGDFRALEKKLFIVFDLVPKEMISEIFASAVVQALQRHELCFFQELLAANGFAGARRNLLFLGLLDPVIERLIRSIRAHCFGNDNSWLLLFPPNEVCPPRFSDVDFTSDELDVSLKLDLA